MSSYRAGRFAWGAALVAAGLSAGTAGAQNVQYPQGAVVQRLDTGPSATLARHVRTLASNPRNLGALIGAGNAALELGDVQAALTFFARAEEVAPRDGRVKAGMGSAFVQNEQPQAALKFFAEAVALGLPDAMVAKDRGLAYDMIGDTARAQADYALALQRGSDPEVERRLALSRAIAGDSAGALQLLEPQVRQNHTAAWRARAFVLALSGNTAEAMKAVKSVMPAQKAAAMEPFLARLPQLSAADRAMAVHFGRFPQGAAYAPIQTAQAQPAASPTVAGAPDSRQAALGTRTASAAPAIAQPPAGSVAAQPRPESRDRYSLQDRWVEARGVSQRTSRPQTAALSPQTAAPALQAPRQASQAATRAPAVQEPAPEEPAPAALPSGSVITAGLTPSTAPLLMPEPAAAAPTATIDFADVAALVAALPGAEAPAPQPAAAEIDPPKPASARKTSAPAKKAEPAEPKEPARIWVQLAAAQDKKAFPAEFRRLQSKAGKLLSGKTAWTAPLRSTNRLLVGPFRTQEEARELVNQLAKLDISSYAWKSEAGQRIEKIPAK